MFETLEKATISYHRKMNDTHEILQNMHGFGTHDDSVEDSTVSLL